MRCSIMKAFMLLALFGTLMLAAVWLRESDSVLHFKTTGSSRQWDWSFDMLLKQTDIWIVNYTNSKNADERLNNVSDISTALDLRNVTKITNKELVDVTEIPNTELRANRTLFDSSSCSIDSNVPGPGPFLLIRVIRDEVADFICDPEIAGSCQRILEHVSGVRARFPSCSSSQNCTEAFGNRHPIVFVSGYSTDEFVRQVHPNFPWSYVLIIHNTDKNSPSFTYSTDHSEQEWQQPETVFRKTSDISEAIKAWWDDAKVLRAFVLNLDSWNVSAKVENIPWGLTTGSQRLPNVRAALCEALVQNSHLSHIPSQLLYHGHIGATGPRYAAVAALARMGIEIPGYPVTLQVEPKDFVNNVLNHEFTISPFGHGLDCHRTYEVLILCRIPVLLSSPMDPFYRKHGALILQSWDEVNISTLQRESITRKGSRCSPFYDELLLDFFKKRILQSASTAF